MNKMLVAALACVVVASVSAAENDIRTACQNDIKTLCSGVQPGGGRIKVCMQEHKDQLSSGCKSALIEQAKTRKGDAG
jgi:hypothetical protein